MADFTRLDEVIKKLEITNFKDMEKFEKYMKGVLEWNEKVNLTNITDEDEFIEKHFIDSILTAGSEEIRSSETIIDVGTGGGFPGIPLAILFPQKKFILMDSLNKRLKIVKSLADEIGILNVEVVHGRAEELARKKEMRESFDLCISRAVANLTTLSELCIPFVKTGGNFIAYKGPGVYEELDEAQKAIEILGGKVDRIEKVEMLEEREHRLLFIKKVNKTDKKYPRKPGELLRNPIK